MSHVPSRSRFQYFPGRFHYFPSHVTPTYHYFPTPSTKTFQVIYHGTKTFQIGSITFQIAVPILSNIFSWFLCTQDSEKLCEIVQNSAKRCEKPLIVRISAVFSLQPWHISTYLADILISFNVLDCHLIILMD